MITEIILIICAITMTASGVYFVVQDIRAKALRGKLIKQEIQKQKEAQNAEPKQGE